VVRIRQATGAGIDREVLQWALYLGATWRTQGTPGAVADTLANPDLTVYVEGWARPGDFGVIVEEAGVPVGAAWYRTFDPDSHGYGFIGSSTPEVAVGVLPAYRGRSLGTQLMRSLIVHARADGDAALSLSVEQDNRALALYRRLGFEIVARSGNAWTMRLATT
jgi:ribosomal protein S18 acetylase RimI-like enzyme